MSSVKLGAFLTAVGLTAAAATELIIAAAVAVIYGIGEILAAVLLGIASALETAALIAGTIANDPPIEDPRYDILYEPDAAREEGARDAGQSFREDPQGVAAPVRRGAGCAARSGRPFSERAPTPAKADEAIRALNHDLPFRAQVLKAWQDVGGSSKDLDALTVMAEFGQLIVAPEAALAVAGGSAEKLAALAAETRPSS